MLLFYFILFKIKGGERKIAYEENDVYQRYLTGTVGGIISVEYSLYMKLFRLPNKNLERTRMSEI